MNVSVSKSISISPLCPDLTIIGRWHRRYLQTEGKWIPVIRMWILCTSKALCLCVSNQNTVYKPDRLRPKEISYILIYALAYCMPITDYCAAASIKVLWNCFLGSFLSVLFVRYKLCYFFAIDVSWTFSSWKLFVPSHSCSWSRILSNNFRLCELIFSISLSFISSLLSSWRHRLTRM